MLRDASLCGKREEKQEVKSMKVGAWDQEGLVGTFRVLEMFYFLTWMVITQMVTLH